MALRGYFGSKTTGRERITLLVLLPAGGIVTLACVYFLLHETPTSADEEPATSHAAARSPAHSFLEPSELLRNLTEAEAIERRGDPEGAGTAFALITKSNPENDRGWGGLGRTQLAQKDFRAAASSFDKACRLNVMEARHFAGRGSAHRALNDLKHALQDYRDALNLEPGNVSTANSMLFVALEADDADLFERTMVYVRQLKGGSEAGWIMAAAAAQIRTGTDEEALALLRKASGGLSPGEYSSLLGDRIFQSQHGQKVIGMLNVSP